MASIGASAQAATNLVTDGNFTTLTHGPGELGGGPAVSNTVATGWTSAGYNFVLAVADQAVNSEFGANDLALWDQANGGGNGWNGLAAAGGNIAAIDGAFLQGPLFQSVSGLIIGQSYDLSFYYAFGQEAGFTGATTQNLDWTLGSDVNSGSGNISVGSKAFTGWTPVNDSFTATATTETLSFLSAASPQTPPFALHVAMLSIPPAIPEPATWAMFLVGFGLLGAVARRRRAHAVTA